VDTLPSEAQIVLDGVPLGRGGARTVPVPDPVHRYAFRVTAPGFAAGEWSAKGAELAGSRIGLALRPEGFGSGRRLEMEDGAGLAAAAALLLRREQYGVAFEYAQRAAEASPDLPLAHRVLGEAAEALGQRGRAIAEYSAYVRLAPEAPDRIRVEKRVEDLRGDLTMPGPGR